MLCGCRRKSYRQNPSRTARASPITRYVASRVSVPNVLTVVIAVGIAAVAVFSFTGHGQRTDGRLAAMEREWAERDAAYEKQATAESNKVRPLSPRQLRKVGPSGPSVAKRRSASAATPNVIADGPSETNATLSPAEVSAAGEDSLNLARMCLAWSKQDWGEVNRLGKVSHFGYDIRNGLREDPDTYYDVPGNGRTTMRELALSAARSFDCMEQYDNAQQLRDEAYAAPRA
jgi:hypothetical protein